MEKLGEVEPAVSHVAFDAELAGKLAAAPERARHHALRTVLLSVKRRGERLPGDGMVLVDDGVEVGAYGHVDMVGKPDHRHEREPEAELPLCLVSPLHEHHDEGDDRGHQAHCDEPRQVEHERGHAHTDEPQPPVGEFRLINHHDKEKNRRKGNAGNHVHADAREPDIGKKEQQAVALGVLGLRPHERKPDGQHHGKQAEVALFRELKRAEPEGVAEGAQERAGHA